MYIRLFGRHRVRVPVTIIIIGTKKQNNSARRKPILIILRVQILAANWTLYDKDIYVFVNVIKMSYIGFIEPINCEEI